MSGFNWLLTVPIAHRGLHNSELPENSIGAFEEAVKKGFSIELDIQLTKDNKIVVFHDYNTSRMTSKNYMVRDLTLQELNKLSLLNTKFKIPLLDDVLNIVNGKVPILIEIKNEGKARIVRKRAM